mmetsp:Transcript_41007/g.101580  ORF Transcript_41007/g.101580 Transcript_41007/m.101580 type:complete len:286 (-) Transcript_41007:44-901(-)
MGLEPMGIQQPMGRRRPQCAPVTLLPVSQHLLGAAQGQPMGRRERPMEREQRPIVQQPPPDAHQPLPVSQRRRQDVQSQLHQQPPPQQPALSKLQPPQQRRQRPQNPLPQNSLPSQLGSDSNAAARTAREAGSAAGRPGAAAAHNLPALPSVPPSLLPSLPALLSSREQRRGGAPPLAGDAAPAKHPRAAPGHPVRAHSPDALVEEQPSAFSLSTGVPAVLSSMAALEREPAGHRFKNKLRGMGKKSRGAGRACGAVQKLIEDPRAAWVAGWGALPGDSKPGLNN